MTRLVFVIGFTAVAALAYPASSQAQYSEIADRDNLIAQQRALMNRLDKQESRLQSLEREINLLRQQLSSSASPSAAPASQGTAVPTEPISTAGRAPSRTAMHSYTVQQGDTLHSIAQKHNVSVRDLTTVNGLSSNKIFLGSQLVIPGAGSSATAVAGPSKPATPAQATPAPTQSQSGKTYRVRSGDTLARISRNHGVSVDELLAANRLANPDRIQIGQELNIPVPGSTLASPTPTPKPATTVAAATPVKQTPPPAPAAPPAAPKPEPAPEPAGSEAFPSGYAFYTVITGDSLYSIARLFGTTEARLLELNAMKPGAIIRPDQQILVPMDQYKGPYTTASAE